MDLSIIKYGAKHVLALPDHLFRPPKPTVMVFLHLPKCAGTMISSLFRSNENPWRTLAFHVRAGRKAPDGGPLTLDKRSSPDVCRLRETLARRGSRVECILGHLPYGVHHLLDRPVRYVTIIRNPVERTWSQFNHILNDQEHYLHPVLRRYRADLVRVLESGDAFEMSNDQVRMILGSDRLELGEADGRAAVGRIEKEFYFAELLERSEAGMVRLGQSLGWRRVKRAPEHRGSYKQIATRPDGRTAEAIRVHNCADTVLYDALKSQSPFSSKGPPISHQPLEPFQKGPWLPAS